MDEHHLGSLWNILKDTKYTFCQPSTYLINADRHYVFRCELVETVQDISSLRFFGLKIQKGRQFTSRVMEIKEGTLWLYWIIHEKRKMNLLKYILLLPSPLFSQMQSFPFDIP